MYYVSTHERDRLSSLDFFTGCIGDYELMHLTITVYNALTNYFFLSQVQAEIHVDRTLQ